MSAAYQELIDATLQHLRELKARQVSWIPLAPDTVRMLNLGPAPRRASSAVAPAGRPPAASSPSRIIPPSVAPSLAPAPVPVPVAASPSVPRVALDPAAKAAAIEELRQRASACMKCPHLAERRRNVVFGVGDLNADLMFVGEAPGADEDVQGEPFVGAAGQLLTKIIQTMGLSRETVYIANILKCRPDMPSGSSGNRKPTPEEMQTCLPYLQAQIDLIQPRLLVALGATAVEGLLGKGQGITRLRGHWQSYRGIPLMPTFHPSYLLHNQNLTEKRKVWEDMLQVLEKLGRPVSEKQRGFFLRA